MALFTSPSNRNVTPIHQDRNLQIIIGITLMAILGIISLNPAMPTLAQAFDVPMDQIGLVIAVFVVPITIGTPIFGMLADRVGRKKILVPSLLLFALGGVLCASAQDFHALLEWRFLQGIGAASLESLALTLIGDLYIGKMLIPAMAFNASMIGIGSTLFPLLGGALAGLSWRLVFLLSLSAVPLALLVITKLKLPKQQVKTENFALKDYLKSTWSSIRNRHVLGLLFAVMCVFMMQFGPCFVYIPMFAGSSLQAKSEIIGILMASMQVSLAFFASQLGFFAKRFSEAQLIKTSFALFAIALSITPFVHTIWLLFIPSILIGAAEALALPPTRAMLARLSPNDARAGFMSVNAMAQSVGQALGPIFAGVAFSFWGMQGVFFACAGFAVIAMIVVHALMTPYCHLKPSLSHSTELYVRR
ncbi:MAG: MFS transporter [Myxacorys chilensis ATA2-1-KO14]|jgi:MFS family permease|nr:MFS transporter [Myxacorys chilensis ATA2-1-KO14]